MPTQHNRSRFVKKTNTAMHTIAGNFTHADIKRWFIGKDFNRIQFNSQNEYVITSWLSQPVVFKLTPFQDYETYSIDGFGGSILVFEWKVEDENLKYNCYAPIWLFGMWTIKLRFKKRASYLFKYLKEGFALEADFFDYVKSVVQK